MKNFFTRDSALWWIIIIGAMTTYLANTPPMHEWTWAQWNQALATLSGIIAGKLATSPLKGKKDVERERLEENPMDDEL